MASIFVRRRKLWCKVKDEHGKWVNKPTPYYVGDEAKAKRYAEKAQDIIAARGGVAGPLTVAQYADRWIKDRRDRGRGCADGEETRLKKHALRLIGALRLDEVRPRHVRDMVRELRKAGTLAPRTIINVYGVVHGMFRDAVIEELIDASPCVLARGEMPAKVDKNPEWRATAVFTRPELVKLISDERLPFDRRVLYALEGLAALRHGEAAGLRWRHLDVSATPLGKLTVATSYDKGRTKTGVTRFMPVHPTLAAMLAEWRLEGWPAVFGRTPTEDDLIVPLPASPRVKGRPNPRIGGMRNKSDSFKRLRADLVLLELRHRRGHDLRRTMISLARMDGARRDLLEVCTHNPRNGTIDLYTSYDWASLCAEVSKLKVTRETRGQLILGTRFGTAAI
jgi:integrase